MVGIGEQNIVLLLIGARAGDWVTTAMIWGE